MDHEEGSRRNLHLYKGNYPGLIASTRGKTWHPDNLEGTPEQIESWGVESVVTGDIPQVAHTYALIEAGYGIMNEHQLAIGESTCAAKLWAAPVTAGGKARIEVREMSQIALERCQTAKCAVSLMGEFAEKLGFYAADWSGGDASKGEGGESLTVVDKTEAWVFHVLSDDSGASAVWAAQRLEPGHVSVVANQFIIREVDPDSSMFLYSANLWDVAERNGFWRKDDGLLNFVETYGPRRLHSPYSTRRMWRAFQLMAPSITLPSKTDTYASDYPFSMKVDKPLTPQDLVDIQRDHYEGTKYDLTVGLAAGPYGDPQRFDYTPTSGQTFEEGLQGSYERAISMFRTSYSFVAVSRAKVTDIFSLVWLSQYAPHATSYTPMYIAADVPTPFTRGSLFKYDSDTSFWNFCAAGNYASRFYKYAIQDIQALQSELTRQAEVACAAVEETAGSATRADAVAMLDSVVKEQAAAVVSGWRDLLPKLITKYHDGYIAKNLEGEDINMQKLFYPKWWLEATGYFADKPEKGPDTIMFASNPLTAEPPTTTSFATVLLTAFVSSALTVALGLYYLHSRKLLERFQYSEITSVEV